MKGVLAMVRLENWSVVGAVNPYLPPERQALQLRGEVYGHPCHADGSMVRTSPIQSAVGRTVQTGNTVYELGTPSLEYEDYCRSINKPFDPNHPFKATL